MSLRRPSVFWVRKQEHCYRGNVAVGSGSRFAISRRNGASHADEIILRLNCSRGATFNFLAQKELRAQIPRRAMGDLVWDERPCTSISGLQFFTIYVFKLGCDHLKVLLDQGCHAGPALI